MQVITVATMSTLPRARVLAQSLKRHQPDWPLTVMLIGRGDLVAAVAAREQSIDVRSVSEVLELDVETLLARHDEEDLTILLLGHLLLRHVERSPEPVVHLPVTAWVLGDLQPLESQLRSHAAVLFPRVTEDVPDDGLEPSLEQLDRAGRIDPAILALDGSASCRELLEWWNEHIEQALGSLDAFTVGARPEDRPWLARFLELAPARFAAGVLEDPGSNLSLWNLHVHTLHAGPDGVTVDDGEPLRFLNLAGFDPDRPYRLAANASRARVSRSAPLRGLVERYAEELREAGWRDTDHRGEVGRRLSDELVYDDSLRATYSRALALGEGFEDLFSEQGTRAFLSWLEGPAPRGGAYGINRYVFYRVSRERPDVLRTFPDLDGEDGPRYVAWCWVFGRDGAGYPRALHAARTRRVSPAAGKARRERCEQAGRPASDTRTFAFRGPAGRRTRPRRGHRRAPDRLSRPHAGARCGGARVRAGAGIGGRAGQHGDRAAAPPGAAGEARGCLRRARLRGSRAARRPRLRDRRGQRRRAAELRRAPGRGLLRGPAHRHLGLGDEQHPAALAAGVRAGRRGLGLLALHGREHRRGRAGPGGRAAAAGAAPPAACRAAAARACPRAFCSCSCSTT